MILAAVIVALVVLPTALAPLGPVDDHEIVRMARGETLPFLEESRFRPLYWVARHLETGLWGTNPWGWAFARWVLGTLTVLLAYTLARRYVHRPVALLGTLLVVVGPQAEAFYRFGPQEAYGMPLLLASLFHPAFAVAAAFTKETFALAVVPVLAYWWWRGRRREAAAAGVFVALALLGVAAAALNGGSATGGTRLLLPWLLVPLAAAMWLGMRHPRAVTLAMVPVFGVGLGLALRGADGFAQMNYGFQATLAQLRAVDGPLVVHAGAGDYERALSLLVWLPGTEATLVVDEPCEGPLCDRLRQVSREGGYGYRPKRG